jgi:hypothetical protein
LAVYAILVIPKHLSTYPHSSTKRKLDVLMRGRGLENASVCDWRGLGERYCGDTRFSAAIRAVVRADPHFQTVC